MLKLILHPYKVNKEEKFAVMFANMPNTVFECDVNFKAGLYQRLTSHQEVLRQLKQDKLFPVCVFVSEPDGTVALIDWDINTTASNSRTKQSSALASSLPIAELLVDGYITSDVAIGLAARKLAVKTLRPVQDVYDAVKTSYTNIRNETLDFTRIMAAFNPPEEEQQANDKLPALNESAKVVIDYSTLPENLETIPELFKQRAPNNKELTNLIKLCNQRFNTDFAVNSKVSLKERREQFLNFVLELLTTPNTEATVPTV